MPRVVTLSVGVPALPAPPEPSSDRRPDRDLPARLLWTEARKPPRDARARVSVRASVLPGAMRRCWEGPLEGNGRCRGS